MIVFSLMHQNDTTSQSIRRECFQIMFPVLGQRFGRDHMLSVWHFSYQRHDCANFFWYHSQRKHSHLLSPRSHDNSPKEMRKWCPSGGLACWWWKPSSLWSLDPETLVQISYRLCDIELVNWPLYATVSLCKKKKKKWAGGNENFNK